MSISLGLLDVADISIGSTDVDIVSLGTDVVWERDTGPPTEAAYLTEATNLGAIALFDGLTCTINADTFDGGTEVAGPDGLTMIDVSALSGFVEAVLTTSVTGPITVVMVAKCDLGLMTTGTTSDTLRTNFSSGLVSVPKLRIRRDSAFDLTSRNDLDPQTFNDEVALLVNGDQAYLMTSLRTQASTPDNDIFNYNYSVDGKVTNESLNRGSTLPDGSAITLNLRPDQPGVLAVGGIAVFDSCLTEAQLDGLAATVPSLDSLII